MRALPLFVDVRGRPVALVGEGEAAAAKRRLLERAGARVVDEGEAEALAIVALEDDAAAGAAVARLRARGVLVNAVDRSALCDFTLPAIVDRDPVLLAIGTGGVSAGLAKALRQRLETLLPARLGDLAEALQAARPRLRARWPEPRERRRAIDAALQPGAALDPLRADADIDADMAGWLASPDDPADGRVIRIVLRSRDPDELTLREARLLAQADRVHHRPDTPAAILARARADAARTTDPPSAEPGPGLTLVVT